MAKETSMGLALKAAVGTLSKKKQTELIAEYIYKKYDVFSRFKPLAVGIDQDLIKAMPQYDAALIMRVLSNHCRRPRYIKALAKGGKRFDLHNRFKGEITAEEQAVAQQHPCMQTANPPATENNAAENVASENNETPVVPAE
ncbi:MAG: osmoprotectant transport activator ProQ [Neisseriaceae bacterium]|nr:osmoprotectant transport activator ProQ [Neisseriaceae bacterium]